MKKTHPTIYPTGTQILMSWRAFLAVEVKWDHSKVQLPKNHVAVTCNDFLTGWLVGVQKVAAVRVPQWKTVLLDSGGCIVDTLPLAWSDEMLQQPVCSVCQEGRQTSLAVNLSSTKPLAITVIPVTRIDFNPFSVHLF